MDAQLPPPGARRPLGARAGERCLVGTDERRLLPRTRHAEPAGARPHGPRAGVPDLPGARPGASLGGARQGDAHDRRGVPVPPRGRGRLRGGGLRRDRPVVVAEGEGREPPRGAHEGEGRPHDRGRQKLHGPGHPHGVLLGRGPRRERARQEGARGARGAQDLARPRARRVGRAPQGRHRRRHEALHAEGPGRLGGGGRRGRARSSGRGPGAQGRRARRALSAGGEVPRAPLGAQERAQADRAAQDLQGRAPALPEARPLLARARLRARHGGAPRGRHGPREDDPGPRLPREGAARGELEGSGSPPLSDLGPRQLAPRGPEVRARPQGPPPPRGRPRQAQDLRALRRQVPPRRHELRPRAPRHSLPPDDQMDRPRDRRGPEPQEPRG